MADAGDGIDAKAGAWTFHSAEVAASFERHVAASVPEYESVQARAASLAAFYARPGSSVVDLGCATGRTLRGFHGAIAPRPLRLLGVDESQAMVDEARRLSPPEVEFIVADASTYRLPSDTSMVFAIYALQFMPIAKRRALIARLGEELAPGAGLLVVEKVVPESSRFVTAFAGLHVDLKRAAGHTADEVLAKSASLRGIMTPVCASTTEGWLRAAGFTVERFWQDLCFAGWICERA
jgi:tRNA (cmo5U34)-methyltransferase